MLYKFRFVVLPASTYLFTTGVEGFYFHLITLRHTQQSVGLLWTRDRPVAETSTDNTNTVQDTSIDAPGGIRTLDPSKCSAADLRLRLRGHWDRLFDKCKKGKAVPLEAWTGPEGSRSPRSLRLPHFKTISTWRWQACQPHAPATFTPQEILLVLFLLEAE
jgi:hypothetical protein